MTTGLISYIGMILSRLINSIQMLMFKKLTKWEADIQAPAQRKSYCYKKLREQQLQERWKP